MQIKDIIKDLTIFESIYDIIRIINPITKEVFDTIFFNGFEKKVKFSDNNQFCYNFWNENKVCENCVSTRSMKTGKSYIKIENNGQYSFLVMSSLIKYEREIVILEFIKKIQNGDAVSSVNFLDYNDIKEVLKEKNLELVIDQLTGAYNRKFIDERLLYNLSFFQNHNKYFSLVLCDIDYFKDVNDKYGHLAGDYVLKWFVSQIKTIIRKDTDWVARYGGDEFIIYLDNIDMDSSVIVINKIRNLINSLTIFFEKEEINITSSFGITKPKLEDDFNSIIKRVDEALYISKTTGRNKVSYL